MPDSPFAPYSLRTVALTHLLYQLEDGVSYADIAFGLGIALTSARHVSYQARDAGLVEIEEGVGKGVVSRVRLSERAREHYAAVFGKAWQ